MLDQDKKRKREELELAEAVDELEGEEEASEDEDDEILTKEKGGGPSARLLFPRFFSHPTGLLQRSALGLLRQVPEVETTARERHAAQEVVLHHESRPVAKQLRGTGGGLHEEQVSLDSAPKYLASEAEALLRRSARTEAKERRLQMYVQAWHSRLEFADKVAPRAVEEPDLALRS
eukprot:scaffold7028_cov243-Pinguiococcus_pyrenoidosus.AAC.21